MDKSHTDNTLRNRYLIGFVLSIVLTVASFAIAMYSGIDGLVLGILLGILAIIQLYVQFTCFLHLDLTSGPQSTRFVFVFMITIVLITVIGSIWIMDNLNYHMMGSPESMRQYMDRNQGF